MLVGIVGPALAAHIEADVLEDARALLLVAEDARPRRVDARQIRLVDVGGATAGARAVLRPSLGADRCAVSAGLRARVLTAGLTSSETFNGFIDGAP